MPSPFPGMDPWLEDRNLFPDFHDTLIAEIRTALNVAMPPGYAATSRNRIIVDESQNRIPDVSLLSPPPSWDNYGSGGGGLATLEGLQTYLQEEEDDFEDEKYLEIYSANDMRLITAIEILSRANKIPKSRARKSYGKKRREFQRGRISLVEIDLLRGGTHTTAAPVEVLSKQVPGYSYHIAVTLFGQPRGRFARAWKLAEPIPLFAVPLDKGQSVKLELQPLLNRAYETGRYHLLAKYKKPCDPPLTAEQQGWADEILKAHLAMSMQTSS